MSRSPRHPNTTNSGSSRDSSRRASRDQRRPTSRKPPVSIADTKIVLLNKPFQVISQFSDAGDKRTLAEFVTQDKDVYPAGRLDYDSEGLLVLTNNGAVQAKISEPRYKLAKTYWAQVEGEIDAEAIKALNQGVELKDGWTDAAKAVAIDEPELWTREPPIRERANIPTSWVELTITEGRNRQVRRMTAAVGHPTLRLVRAAIGPWTIDMVPKSGDSAVLSTLLTEQFIKS